MSDLKRLEGLVLEGDQLTIAFGNDAAKVQLTVDQMRGLAIALALAADRLQGIESPPEARLFGDDFAGTA